MVGHEHVRTPRRQRRVRAHFHAYARAAQHAAGPPAGQLENQLARAIDEPARQRQQRADDRQHYESDRGVDRAKHERSALLTRCETCYLFTVDFRKTYYILPNLFTLSSV